MMAHQADRQGECGFTLIELLVTTVIALVILAGLLLNFAQQNTEFNYQNKRVDAVQDLELAIKFISEDLRAALMRNPTPNNWTHSSTWTDPYPAENNNFSGTGGTGSITFWVWDPDTVAGGNRRAQRRYDLVGTSLRLDRDYSTPSMQEILPNVTFFKIFRDDISVGSRASFIGIPDPLPSRIVTDPDNNPVSVPGYTILVEIEVEAGYKGGVKQDVMGNATTTKRVWRYVQVHPMAVVQ